MIASIELTASFADNACPGQRLLCQRPDGGLDRFRARQSSV